MSCNDCPELNPNPNEGCLQPINSSCVTYDGNDIDCAGIASGETISQVIETLANSDCNLQEQINDLEDDLQELSGVVQVIDNKIEELSGSQYIFDCSELSACSLDDLSDVDVTPVSGDSLIFNGEKWINYTPEEKYQFSCEELSECELNSLGNVDTNPVSGDSIIFNGEKWVNYTPEEIVPYQFTCEELSGCTLDELSGIVLTDEASGDVLLFNGNNWVNYPILETLLTLQSTINGLVSQVDIQNNAITLLSIRMDECACPTGAALDVDFSDARLNLCTQNTTLGKFIVDFLFTGSGTDLNDVEGVTLITVSIPDSVNPLLYVTPTTIPDVSPVSKTFALLSGMKSEIALGGGGGTITYTVRFTDNSAVVHFAEITFSIPEFDTTGDNCDQDLVPSSVVFDNIL